MTSKTRLRLLEDKHRRPADAPVITIIRRGIDDPEPTECISEGMTPAGIRIRRFGITTIPAHLRRSD